MADYVWNSADKSSDINLSNGDLTATRAAGSGYAAARGTPALPGSGKYYFEIDAVTVITGMFLGIGTLSETLTYPGDTLEGYGFNSNGDLYHDSSKGAGTTFENGDVIGIAVDADAGKIWWAKNNVWILSGDPAAGTNENYSGLSGTFYAMCGLFSTAGVCTLVPDGDSQTYSPPSGFSPLEPPTGEIVVAVPFELVGSLAGGPLVIGVVATNFELVSSFGSPTIFLGPSIIIGDSIRSQILKWIGARCTVINTENGFNTNIGNNVAQAKNKFTVDDPPLCVLFPGVEEGSKKYGKQICKMPVTIEASSYFNDEEPEDVAEKMLADLIICIGGGTLQQVTGGLADQIIYTGGGSESYPDPGEKIVGTRAAFDVVYKYLAGNPLSQ